MFSALQSSHFFCFLPHAKNINEFYLLSVNICNIKNISIFVKTSQASHMKCKKSWSAFIFAKQPLCCNSVLQAMLNAVNVTLQPVIHCRKYEIVTDG